MIATPRSLPRIARVISHHPYRTARPWDLGNRTHRIDYRSGDPIDPIDRLEGALAVAMGRRDNHHGWLVEGPKGERHFFYFSDGQLTVWSMPPDEPARSE